MGVEYVVPLERAVGRMKALLFRPFRLETWIVVGFAAFLARLLEGGGGGTQGVRYVVGDHPGQEPGEGFERIREALAEPFWLLVAGAVLVLVLVLAVLFTWISSRAKFVFLDDVVRERAAIAEPWRRHARLGDSLFLWRLVFGICVLAGTLILVVPFVAAVIAAGATGAPSLAIGTALLLVPVVLLWAIAASYTAFFLENFVVPIMYRHGLPATRAWGKFLPLLRANFWRFVLVGLFVFVLFFGVVLALVVAGCATCCCGFLLIAIPYVGSVVLLPISAAYRAYGPEFLAQFGPEWSVFEPAPPPEATPLT